MKVETKQQVDVRNVTVYIADDGTEFDNRWKCQQYEIEKVHKPLLEKLTQCEELNWYANFDGQEYPEHHDYRWYFVRDEEDLAILEIVYPDTLGKIHIGKWVCIETDEDGSSWASTVDDGITYATTVLNALGYKVEITKEAE